MRLPRGAWLKKSRFLGRPILTPETVDEMLDVLLLLGLRLSLLPGIAHVLHHGTLKHVVVALWGIASEQSEGEGGKACGDLRGSLMNMRRLLKPVPKLENYKAWTGSHKQ